MRWYSIINFSNRSTSLSPLSKTAIMIVVYSRSNVYRWKEILILIWRIATYCFVRVIFLWRVAIKGFSFKSRPKTAKKNGPDEFKTLLSHVQISHTFLIKLCKWNRYEFKRTFVRIFFPRWIIGGILFSIQLRGLVRAITNCIKKQGRK